MVEEYSRYEDLTNEYVSDVLADCQLPLFPQVKTDTKGKLRVLSLFSGCGGMDIGFEGGFICHKKSINPRSEWIEEELNANWVRVKETNFKSIIPYFDQVVVIISSIIMLPELYKVLKENITSVLLFAPNKDLTDEIKNIIEKHLLNTNMRTLHYDIVKTGRKIWISIYFRNSDNIVDIMQLKEITMRCSKELNEKIGNIYFELVPDVENYYS